MRKVFRRTLLGLLIGVSGLYGVNAVILTIAQPAHLGSKQTFVDKNSFVADDATVNVVFVKDLNVNLTPPSNLVSNGVVAGYVDIVSPDNNMYINFNSDANISLDDYLYHHELAHIYQKQLVAEVSGGYPSYWNPFTSFVYYFNLARLELDLRAVMPSSTSNGDALVTSPFPGIEEMADCNAEQINNFGLPMQYVGSEGCGAEAHYIATMLVSEGRWPSPLTSKEAKIAYSLQQARIMTYVQIYLTNKKNSSEASPHH